ncbi:hypothetical protein [Anderseniella sp. Alg231-50]|uniref:hypothetical protein n=1 Tax=Anderseniella sp. Alg231-50 TaxID=1922226 RepID=UPI000D558B9F
MSFNQFYNTVSDEAGSTVIEIIVAFAIVSIALIQGFDLIASSARSAAALAEKTSALAVAENQVALLRTAGNPEAAQKSGRTDNGFAYSVKVSPVQATAAPTGTAATLAYKVTVQVNKNEREVVSLETWALFPFDRQ